MRAEEHQAVATIFSICGKTGNTWEIPWFLLGDYDACRGAGTRGFFAHNVLIPGK
jgi:hypothetical protein